MDENANHEFDSFIFSLFKMLVDWRVLVHADVEVDHFFPRDKDSNKVDGEVEAKSPQADKHHPEVILDRTRILQPEDENVLWDHNDV